MPNERAPSWRHEAETLLKHALPVLVAQLSSVGLMMVDTSILGRVGATDLAAIAVSGAIAISLLVALTGVVQALTPLTAHALGSGDTAMVGRLLQQGIYTALLLSLAGALVLALSPLILKMFATPTVISERALAYITLIWFALPGVLLFRTFVAFCNGLAQPRILMIIGLTALAAHTIIASQLAFIDIDGQPLGIIGCGISYLIVVIGQCTGAYLTLRHGRFARYFTPLRQFEKPDRALLAQILKLGLPIGLTMFVEVTAFTMIALLLAPFGEDSVAAHRIAGSIATTVYMVPLSISIAAMAAVARALGRGDTHLARRYVLVGAALAIGISTLAGGLVWWFADAVLALVTNQPKVTTVALSIMACLAAYQCFDAAQTLIAYVLRAYRVTVAPMLLQIVSFWGVGLVGGWLVAFYSSSLPGILGFWWCMVASLLTSSLLLCLVLWHKWREPMPPPPPAREVSL